jgi:predicted histidine transporter YuiF (NhaC family)
MEQPLIAGAVSTVLFVSSMIPMLAKAARTKDLASYSLSYIALSNLANAIHTTNILSNAANAPIASEALP